MTRVVVVVKGFHPPWCSGVVAYARGLVKSIVKLALKSSFLSDVEILSTIRIRLKQASLDDIAEALKLKDLAKIEYLSMGSSFREDLALLSKILKFKDKTVIHICELSRVPKAVLHIVPSKSLRMYHVLTSPRNFFDRLTQKLYRRPGSLNEIVFSSEKLARDYGFNASKTNVVPPAIDTSFFKRDYSKTVLLERVFTREDLNIVEQTEHALIYIGPLLQERFPYKIIIKSMETLYKLYKVKPTLIVVFREAYSKSLKRFIEYADRVGVRSRIIYSKKLLSDGEKIALYSINTAKTLLYLPIKEALGYPMVIPPISVLEAMSCEVSVVSTKILGLDYIVKNGYNGFVLENLNSDLLAEKIYLSHEMNRVLGLNARSFVEKNNSITVISGLIDKLYKKLGLRE